MCKDIYRGHNVSAIAFIVCTNDKDCMDECKFYIEQLYVPEGMEASIITLDRAESMTSGYNEVMKFSDARYKVYLHQDVFIVNRNFIHDILQCFENDEEVGMIGVAGARHLPGNGDAWKSLDVGGCYSVGTFSEAGNIAVKPDINNPPGDYEEVEFIDGMLMATAYDLEWDERIEGFHFYDVAQCVRYRNNGLKIAVARQEEIWVFHDFGPLNLETYNVYRKRFCELYTEYRYEEGEVADTAKIYQLCNKVASVLKSLFDSKHYIEVEDILRSVDNAIYFNQELLTIYFLMEIHKLENMLETDWLLDIPCKDDDFKSRERRYFKLRWLLIRAEFGYESVEHIVDMIAGGIYSISAVIVTALHNIPQESMYMLNNIGKSLEKRQVINAGEWDKYFSIITNYEKKNLPSAKGL